MIFQTMFKMDNKKDSIFNNHFKRIALRGIFLFRFFGSSAPMFGCLGLFISHLLSTSKFLTKVSPAKKVRKHDIHLTFWRPSSPAWSRHTSLEHSYSPRGARY